MAAVFNVKENLTGRRFGALRVMGTTGLRRHRQPVWICKCDCGKAREVLHFNVPKTRSSTCQCQRAESSMHGKLKHGFCKYPEYLTWLNMIGRCKSTARQYCRSAYFERGIIVHAEWKEIPKGFERFIAHIGPRPTKDHSLDRINVNGNYAPGNVRWATLDVQMANRRKRVPIDRYTDEELLAELNRRGLLQTESQSNLK